MNRFHTRAIAAVSIPWNAFVAAFMYYALLAVLALGGASPGTPVVATAYLAPAVMYAVTVASRALRAAAGLIGRVLPMDAVRVR